MVVLLNYTLVGVVLRSYWCKGVARPNKRLGGAQPQGGASGGKIAIGGVYFCLRGFS